MVSLRHLQRVQPRVIPYSAEFQASVAANPWRQVEHDVMHVLKGLGRIAAWAEQADHGTVRTIPRAEIESNLADLVVCALHIASTLHLELEDAVIQNMERRNGVTIPRGGAEGARG